MQRRMRPVLEFFDDLPGRRRLQRVSKEVPIVQRI